MDDIEKKLRERFCDLERGDLEYRNIPNVCHYTLRLSWQDGESPKINVVDIKSPTMITQFFGKITEEQVLEFLEKTNQIESFRLRFQAKIDAFVADADKWGIQHHNDKDAFYKRNVW